QKLVNHGFQSKRTSVSPGNLDGAMEHSCLTFVLFKWVQRLCEWLIFDKIKTSPVFFTGFLCS
ncbi:mCG1045731, partial [Mus musculus]